MNLALLFYPLLIAADVLLIVETSGRMRYALFVFLSLHVLCWILAEKNAMRTLGFYVSLGLAWLIIAGHALDAPFFLRSLAAVGVLTLALLAWGSGTNTAGFRAPKARSKPSRWRWLRYTVPVGLLSAAAALLMADPIPRSSKAILEMGSGLRDMAAPWLQSLGIDSSTGDDAADGGAAEPGDSDTADFGERRPLPARADLQTGNDLHVFLKFPDERDYQTILTQRPYVRQLVLNGYADGEWFHLPGAERLVEDEDDGQLDDRVRLRNARFRGLSYRAYAIGSTGRSLPMLAGVIEAEFPRIVEVLDGWYQAGIPGDVTYAAVSETTRFEDLKAADLRSGVTSPEYLQVSDRDLLRRLRALLGGVVEADAPLREKLMAIRRFMAQNYAYSTRIENPDALPPVENFLFHEKRGYCDFFATAGALLCRSMGLPARVAYGFAGGEAHRSEQIVSFRGNHAHSWTEVYLDGFGWTIYDLTPAASDATRPSPVDSTRSAPDPSFFADARSDADAPENSDGAVLSFIKNLPPKAVYYAIAAALACLLALRMLERILARGETGDRKRRRKRDGRSPVQVDYAPYPEYFLDFRKLCRLLGCQDEAGDTLRELMRKVAARGISLGEEFDAMSRYHYGVRYGGNKGQPSLEKQFRRQIRGFWKTHKP